MMQALYSLMCEGYTDRFRVKYGKGMMMRTKSGLEINKDDIPDYFSNSDAIHAVNEYSVYSALGFPRANWEECPAKFVDLVLILKPLDEMYHPRSTLF